MKLQLVVLTKKNGWSDQEENKLFKLLTPTPSICRHPEKNEFILIVGSFSRQL